MLGKILTVGSVVVATLEIIGFYALHSYLSEFGIGIHFSGIPVLELPSYAIRVLLSAPGKSGAFITVLFVGLIIFGMIQLLIDRSAGQSNRISYVAHPAGSNVFNSVLPSFLRDVSRGFPLYQVVVMIFLLFTGLISAENWAHNEAIAASTGKASSLRPEALGKDSVSLIPIKGVSLPTGIKDENKNGALSLIWEDEKTYYVQPIHGYSSVIGGKLKNKVAAYKIFADWFAINRSQIAAIKHSRQVSSVKITPYSPDNYILYEYIVTILLFALIIICAGVRQYSSDQNKAITIRLFDASELAALKPSPYTARSILEAISRGKDCTLVSYVNGESQNILIRHNLFDSGAVLSIKKTQ